jgi:hypothetical protein
MKVLPLVCGRGGRGTFFTPKMGHFFNIPAPCPHTNNKTFILHPYNHFDIEKQNCQISFLKNNWKFWMPASSKCNRYTQCWCVFQNKMAPTRTPIFRGEFHTTHFGTKHKNSWKYFQMPIFGQKLNSKCMQSYLRCQNWDRYGSNFDVLVKL